MKNRKTTRRALFSSVISLILCCAMLVGTTFAWFTDSVVSGDNIITAGNLDVELYHSDKNATEERVSTDTALFDDVELWEPGAVVYENFKVANEGDLTLKYQLKLNFTEANYVEDENGNRHTLSDVLKVAVVPGGFEGGREEAKALWETINDEYLSTFARSNTLNPKNDKGDIDEYGVVIYWEPTDNDNFYNMKADGGAALEPLTIKVNVELFATQVEAEVDSFDNTYDDEAYDDLELPDVIAEVQNIEDLAAALLAGKTAKLMNDLVLDSVLDIPEDTTAAIDLNGKTLTLTGAAARVFNLRANQGGGFNILGALIISDSATGGKIEVAKDAAGIVVDSNADLQIDGGEITAAAEAVAITAIGGASVDVKGGKISGDGDAIAVVPGGNADSKAVIVIGDGATVDNIDVAAGADAKVTFYGNKAPEMTGDGVAENTVHKGTSFEDVTQDPNNEKQYYIDSKEGLMNLNAFLNTIDTGEGNVVTVDLLTDVDLAGEEWAPIESTWVVFNGNKHTIKNVNAGMASDGRRSGFWAYAGAVTINELTLENVTVSGSQAGIFAGSAEGLKVNNCYLKGDNTVNFVAGVETWNGIGAITGVLVTSDVNVEIVSGATVNLNTNGMTTDPGCTYVDDLTGYIQANKGIVTNNGTIIKGISTAAELLAYSAKALTGNNGKAESATLALLNDIDMAGAEFSAIVAQRGDTLTFNGNGHTISNVKLVSGANDNDNTTGQASMFYAYPNSTLNVSKLILENVTVNAEENGTGYAAAVIGYCEGTANLTNVDVINATVVGVKSSGVLAGHMSGSLTATNCDISGTVTLADFAEEANGHYAGKYVGTAAGAIVLNSCTANVTVGGNLNAANDGGVYGRIVSPGKLIVDGAELKTASSQDALNSAVSSGSKVEVTLAAGNYSMPGISGDVTISGTEDTVITVAGTPGGSDVTFDGVTVQGSGYSTGVNTATATYNDVTIKGDMCLYGEKVVFNNCTFELNNQYIWTYGAKDVEFNNCTFNTTGKAILIYNEGSRANSKVTVNGCTFNASAGAKAGAIANQNCAAIEIDSTYGDSFTLVTTGQNNVGSDFSGLWRIKSINAAVTVNGAEYTTIAIDGKTMTIDANKKVTIQ